MIYRTNIRVHPRGPRTWSARAHTHTCARVQYTACRAGGGIDYGGDSSHQRNWVGFYAAISGRRLQTRREPLFDQWGWGKFPCAWGQLTKALRNPFGAATAKPTVRAFSRPPASSGGDQTFPGLPRARRFWSAGRHRATRQPYGPWESCGPCSCTRPQPRHIRARPAPVPISRPTSPLGRRQGWANAAAGAGPRAAYARAWAWCMVRGVCRALRNKVVVRA